ncbi:hypothetical protein OPV22_023559 [Ensete ventricosum]|uniref:Uncharacterized protein n=1 Tax=Ensete ventricosum TaxID=4639 RepID=A0AAV8QM50_ENSVE|nr:hypothetical protein OPV22_023559 [Ensete ventricosum]
MVSRGGKGRARTAHSVRHGHAAEEPATEGYWKKDLMEVHGGVSPFIIDIDMVELRSTSISSSLVCPDNQKTQLVKELI